MLPKAGKSDILVLAEGREGGIFMLYTIPELKTIVAPVARKHGVRRVTVFGSYGRGEATEHSDVDLCIDKGSLRSMLQLIAFQQDMEDALKGPVDVVTSDSRDQRFLEGIRKDEVLLYEQ